jgi:two-component system, NarL family, response regulator NreC
MSKSRADKPIRVLLVDDHAIVRDGLRLTLASDPGFQIAGEARDGQTALQQLEQNRPDVIVMDIGLPDTDGIVLSRQILARWPAVKIIVLSALSDRQHLEDALKVGVAGYLLKINAVSELMRAIRTVMLGQTFFSPEVSTVLAGGYKELLAVDSPPPDAGLSERELGVLKLIAEGRNTKEIAADLGVSVKTIESHRTRIMTKLNLHSVADLTKYALRKGYTSL